MPYNFPVPLSDEVEFRQEVQRRVQQLGINERLVGVMFGRCMRFGYHDGRIADRIEQRLTVFVSDHVVPVIENVLLDEDRSSSHATFHMRPPGTDGKSPSLVEEAREFRTSFRTLASQLFGARDTELLEFKSVCLQNAVWFFGKRDIVEFCRRVELGEDALP